MAATIVQPKARWPPPQLSPASGMARDDRQRRLMTDEALPVHIRAVYAETHGPYGSPRLWRKLGEPGVRVS